MPIKNLTRHPRPELGIPKFGDIRPGEKRKSKNGTEYPTNLDYWRVTFQPGYEYLEAPFKEMYGDKPREFNPVFVVGATVDEAFSNWWMAFNTSRTMLRKCDGESILAAVDDNGRYREYDEGKHPCVCPALVAEYEKRTENMSEEEKKQVKQPLVCGRRGWLNLILLPFNAAIRMPGYFTVHTGSAENIRMIYNRLYQAEQDMGTLIKVPFVFGRGEPEEKNRRFGDGERRKVKESMYYLYTHPAAYSKEAERQLQEVNVPQLSSGTANQQTSAPTGYQPVEQVRVDWNESDEFFTYTFMLPNDDLEAEYTGDASAFIQAGINGADRWNPGDVVIFEPALQVKVKDEGGTWGITSVQEYKGLPTVDTPDTPF